ncbi:MAG: response regulator [Elusimicrobiota bacterium]
MINLLIVDDDKSLCVPIKKFFEDNNYKVDMVHDGRSALKYIENKRPHLVFLDIGLPDISGIEVLKKIKEIDETIKVIMITAYEGNEKMREAKKLGASEYIRKPFELEYLREEGLKKVQRQLFEELRKEHEKEFKIRNVFQRYVPENVVNEVLNKSDKIIGGKKVNAAVLMSDIRNFSDLTNRLNPEKVVSMLNSYFQEMVKSIYNNGGIVDKFIGDGIMSVFGVPVSKSNYVKDSVSAAIEMVEKLKEFNKENKKKYGEVTVGIGINTGEVIAGNIGCEEKIEYTVIGDVVNIATKIENLTKKHPNGILISESTYNEVSDFIEAENLGNILPKREKEVVYKVKGFK